MSWCRKVTEIFLHILTPLLCIAGNIVNFCWHQYIRDNGIYIPWRRTCELPIFSSALQHIYVSMTEWDWMKIYMDIQQAPCNLIASVWRHFGIQVECKSLDECHSVCEVCLTTLTYFRSNINMRYPSLVGGVSAVVATVNQRAMHDAFWKVPSELEDAKHITKSIATFIAKDSHLYSLIENKCFGAIIHILEPRYRIPSQHIFTYTRLFNAFKAEVSLESYLL